MEIVKNMSWLGVFFACLAVNYNCAVAYSKDDQYVANDPKVNPSPLPLFNGHGCDNPCDDGDRVYEIVVKVRRIQM